jgi:hypothetical protein
MAVALPAFPRYVAAMKNISHFLHSHQLPFFSNSNIYTPMIFLAHSNRLDLAHILAPKTFQTFHYWLWQCLLCAQVCRCTHFLCNFFHSHELPFLEKSNISTPLFFWAHSNRLDLAHILAPKTFQTFHYWLWQCVFSPAMSLRWRSLSAPWCTARTGTGWTLRRCGTA